MRMTLREKGYKIIFNAEIDKNVYRVRDLKIIKNGVTCHNTCEIKKLLNLDILSLDGTNTITGDNAKIGNIEYYIKQYRKYITEGVILENKLKGEKDKFFRMLSDLYEKCKKPRFHRLTSTLTSKDRKNLRECFNNRDIQEFLKLDRFCYKKSDPQNKTLK